MSIELKPCPFCGEESDLKILRHPSGMASYPEWVHVHCVGCGADGSWEWTEAGAAESWNTRTPPSDWREARELLDKTYQPDSGNLTAAYLVGLADGKAEARGTCHDTFTRFDAWTCSECGERIDYGYQPRPGEYCRGCGAKVVEGWDERAEPRACATCYYYQTVYERGRRTQRKACFGEHLHAAVGGLDWEDEAECWADMAPSDHCTNWTPRD